MHPSLQALIERPQWVVWKLVERDGELSKPPFRARQPSKNASSTDPKSWARYEEAEHTVADGKADGVGYCLTADDRLVFIDLDKCRDPGTGKVEPWALEIVRAFNSYTEVSPSGTGLHILVRGSLPESGGRSGKIEVYCSGRYMTVSGQVFEDLDEIAEAPDGELRKLWQRVRANGSATPGDDLALAEWRGDALFQRYGNVEVSIRKDSWPPGEKHQLLLENGESYRKAWFGKLTDDDSKRDWLAGRDCADAGWTDQEIADMIVGLRRHYKEDAKCFRHLDYVARTIYKIRQSLREGMTYQDAQFADLDVGDEMQVISNHLGHRVTKITKSGKDPATYWLHVDGQPPIDIGNARKLLDQTHIRVLLAERLGPPLMQRFKEHRWHAVVGRMIAVAVEEEADFDEREHFLEMLAEYLESRKPIPADDDGYKAAVLENRPVVTPDGEVAIHADSLRQWLDIAKSMRFDVGRVRTILKKAGLRRKTLSIDTTSRSFWCVTDSPMGRGNFVPSEKHQNDLAG